MINELLSHTDPPLEDAVEFFNPTGTPVDISGWYLSNSSRDLGRFVIPAGTVIPARGYKVIYEGQFGTNGFAGLVTPFTFNSAHGDTAFLSQISGGQLTGYRAGAVFGAAANGVSFGRFLTSVGADFVAMNRRTFGVDNPTSLEQFRTGLGAANPSPLVGPIVINEIMYHAAPAVPESPGLFDRLKGDWKTPLENIRATIERATEHIVKLMAIFLLQTLVIPVFLLWVLYRLATGAFRPSLLQGR